jgi:hypothetical protein
MQRCFRREISHLVLYGLTLSRLWHGQFLAQKCETCPHGATAMRILHMIVQPRVRVYKNTQYTRKTLNNPPARYFCSDCKVCTQGKTLDHK